MPSPSTFHWQRTLIGALTFGVLLSCGESATAPPAPVAQISFAESVDSLELGSTIRLTPRLLDAQGNVLSGRTLTWTAPDTLIATVDGTGSVTAKQLGTTTIFASAGSATGSVLLVVRPIEIARVTFPATSFNLVESDTITLPIPQLIDRAGTTVTNRHVTYSVAAGSAVNVTPSGFVTAPVVGTGTVVAAIDTVRVSLTFTVAQAPVATVKVLPSLAYVGVGRSLHTQASAYAPRGGSLRGRQYAYTSADPSIAAVNASGVITGRAPGSTSVTVSASGTTFTVPVSVATLGTGTFSIDLRFLGNVSPTLRAAATQAAGRWRQVVTTALVPYQVRLTADTASMCMRGLPAVNELVPNMIVYVRADSIDGPGGIAGLGGPCVIRDDAPQLTALGTLEVDTADVAWAASNGVLVDLITHEMGHILGIGTLWDDNIYQPVPGGPPPPHVATGIPISGCGADPEFIGSTTRTASSALGFTSSPTLGVPIENTGGLGTCNSHWRATTFGHELMTGTLHSGSNPLSLVTIDALGDLGYVVAPQAEDDFSILNSTNPAAFPAPSLSLSVPLVERITGPRFTITRSGQLNPIRARIVPAP